MRRHLADWLRRRAETLDRSGTPKLVGYSFTFELGVGIVFRTDGLGCPLAYLRDEDYRRAHTDAGTLPEGFLPAVTMPRPRPAC